MDSIILFIASGPAAARRRRVRERRGVLLLVVLSVLTLFMMLGVSYVVVATRARKSARAFANNAVAATAAGATEQTLLDQAFMTLVRGSPDALPNAAPLGSGTENLLADKYGSTTVVGRVAGASALSSSAAFIQITTSNLNPAPAFASELAGRVVTISLPGLFVSSRILQATGAATTPSIVIAAGPTVVGKQLSAASITAALANVVGSSTTTLVINGREFAGATGSVNEPWDGIDTSNPLFAQIKSEDTNANGSLDSGEDTNSNGAIDSYFAMPTNGLGSSGTMPLVDNDGDGFDDSRFLDINLPPMISPSGGVLWPRAAILVADLDGRINVNAHGSGADEAGFSTTAGREMYPTLPAGLGAVPLYQLPRGSGIGPAEVSIDRSLLFGSNPATNQDRVANSTVGNSGLSITSANGLLQDAMTLRYAPWIQNAEGRYGDTGGSGAATFGGVIASNTSAKPGVDGSNDLLSVAIDQWRASLDTANVAQSYFVNAGRFGSPPDFKGQMRIWVDDTGQPVYYKPYWRTGSGSPPQNVVNETVDDPYEVNLTRSGSRLGSRRTPSSASSPDPADSLFSASELEAVLRYHDPDSPKLPPRLVALLRDGAARSRLAITTESWDTPAIVTDAWQMVINGTSAFSTLLNATGLVAPRRAQDLFSPETLAGHRMDLNRPFHVAPNYDEPNDATGIARRQSFARQLYCLFVAIATKNGTAMTPALTEQIAQYAVNVVDFRDADSIMTKFEFDPSFAPTNTAWSPGPNNYVWGCERPEILITETWAWHDRRTNDLATPGGKVVDMPAVTADSAFDQQRRPQGAFFVELFSPWGSQVREYDSASSPVATRAVADPPGSTTAGDLLRGEPVPKEFAATEDINGNGTLDSGEDTNSNSVIDYMPPRERRAATISLARMAPSSSPVWRLVTVRGTAAFGTDPVTPATTNPTKSILDPSRPGVTIPIDRAFYFAQPSNTIQLSTGSNSAFWQHATGGLNPSPTNYVVVGTDAPFNPLTTGTAPANTRTFTGAAGQPATISEPLSASDPYNAVIQAASPGTTYTAPAGGNGYVGSWSAPIDTPLDAYATFPAAITSSPFLLAGNPLLMTNGTHDNFAVVHLQRLADPTQAWNASSNPYVTVDSMTVDLTVVNTSPAGVNYDEPGTTGPSPLTYLAFQKPYGRTTAAAPISTERGGKIAQISGPTRPAHDIWCATVDAAATPIPLNDAESFRTDPIASSRAATAITPGATVGTLNPVATTITASGTATVPGATHSLSFPPERFYDSTNAKVYPFAWMAWANKPFVSASELALVPAVSPFTLLRSHSVANGSPRPFGHLPGFLEAGTLPSPWDAICGRVGSSDHAIWQFVHVPSPFAGLYRSVPNASANTAALTALGLDIFPLNQISSFREPGRINVNMIGDKRVWRGLFGSVTDRNDRPNPTTAEPACELIPGWTQDLFVATSGTSLNKPAGSWLAFMQSMPSPGKTVRPATPRQGGFLDNNVNEDKNANSLLDPTEDANGNGDLDTGEDVNGNGVLDPAEDVNSNGILESNDYRDTGRHAFFRYQTTNRLMNNVTVRSNVFAVWVTIGYFDASNAEVTPVLRNRAFYVIDRSIPVGYERGKNHNVNDAVILRRVIQ